VYDSEAVKTVGLANRLMAEKSRPQCDVFWSNEELRTRQLAARGLFRETNAWAAAGYRSRRMVINTNKVSADSIPRSLSDLTNACWNGKVALAYPLFGTTAAHFLTLRQSWGEGRWLAWCRALAAGRPFVVDGNSVVVKLVGRGEAWVGMTDSDDIAAELKEGAPIAALPLDQESLLIASTVAVVRDAPHPETAQALYDYLRQPGVTRRLVDRHALERVSTVDVQSKTLRPDWDRVLGELDSGTEALKEIFLR
jgi:iron(III) transport system substrate-binding protein